MSIDQIPNISSFVIRFVVSPFEAGVSSTYRGTIRHIQSDEEFVFSEWREAVNFIQNYVDIQDTLYADQLYLLVGATDIDIESSASPTTSGAFAIGVNDELDYSDNTNVQAVLNDLDSALSTVDAKANIWTDGGTYAYLTNTADDLVVGSSSNINAPLFFDVSQKIYEKSIVIGR